MGGALIETEARKLKNEGITEGKISAYIEMIKDNLISISDAAKKLGMTEGALKTYIK